MTITAIDKIAQSYQGDAPKDVVKAIAHASQKTGVDFAYLMDQAAAESNFDTDASAKTSSAKGLYQFIDQTWLHMVKQHGHKYGLSEMASQIKTTPSGRAYTETPLQKTKILALRDDAKLSSLMAAELSAGNKARMEDKLPNTEIGATEMYFAHFMGAGGAIKFMKALEANPDQKAAEIFGREARANKNVFYDHKTGKARSMEEVYAFFDRKFQSQPTPTNTATQAQIMTAQADMPPMPTIDHTYEPSISSTPAGQFDMAKMQSPLMVMLMDQMMETVLEADTKSSFSPTTPYDDQNRHIQDLMAMSMMA